MTRKIGVIFVQEFVLGFGFLSGSWVHIGIDPGAEVLKAFSLIIQALAPNSGFSLFFWLIPVLLTIASMVASFFVGGLLGLTAVGSAFLAGILIESLLGIFLLILAVILGLAAPSINTQAKY